MIVGIHERDDITSSALSYFAPDMPQRIKDLQMEGISISDESASNQEEVFNATLTSPDGNRIFLFEGDF